MNKGRLIKQGIQYKTDLRYSMVSDIEEKIRNGEPLKNVAVYVDGQVAAVSMLLSENQMREQYERKFPSSKIDIVVWYD